MRHESTGCFWTASGSHGANFTRKSRRASLVEGQYMVDDTLLSTDRMKAAHEFLEVETRFSPPRAAC